MFLICVFFSLTIASAVNYFRTRKQRALITNISGPLTLPLFGSMHKFLLLNSRNFLQKSQAYLGKFGTLSRCWVFDRLFILTADYEFVEQLLNNTDHLNTGYSNLLRPLYGAGILRADGEQWQQRRQLVTHAFRPQMLEDFVAVFVQQTQRMVERLSAVCDGKSSFDLQPYVTDAVLDVMIETALGVQGEAQRDACSNYAKAVMDLTQIFMERFLSVNSANRFVYAVMCPRMRRRQRRLLKTINELNIEFIEQRRSALERENKDANKLSPDNIYSIQVPETPTHTPTMQKHITLLDTLITSHIAGVPLTNEEICDELNTYIFQGYVLTTSVLCFTLIMISRYPSVQQTLQDELRDVWPKRKTQQPDYTAENLRKLQYLDCVIKETMRLYPAQPIVSRDLKENFAYTHSQIGTGVIPAGAEIYIDLHDMLRAAERFDQPEVFLPERYCGAAPDVAKVLLYYGMGPRSCPAKQFNMLIVKSVIAQVLFAYELLPLGEEVRPEAKLALSSANGFQLALRKRAEWQL